tara:strand:+ start:353 stop:1777 length:1425 start_codon:yes stop_codon:yes gene_type:complete
MEKTSYITTTLPYVNDVPHMGHALEFVHADIIARWKRICDNDVFFNTGTDEHGVKIYKKAQEVGIDPIDYTEQYAAHFKELLKKLHISEHNFIRTTDEDHKKAAQAFWMLCNKNGDIYKKEYKIKYCIGCELEKTDSELIDNKCSVHPNLEIEIIEEENYFFRLSNYQERLLKLYDELPCFVVPQSRLNEIKNFVASGLCDFSISRLKEKMPWGVPVPGDDEHVMYVWFDALVNYISAIGWPTDSEKFQKYWTDAEGVPQAIQIAGKDNLRQQSAMWQAMLMSAGLPTSRKILIHGFITSGGQKMSKSLGNVIDPNDLIEKYGAEAVRYYLAREMNTFEDSDLTEERFKQAFNAHLANGLGNLVARVMKLAESNLDPPVGDPGYRFGNYLKEKMDEFRIDLAMDYIWDKIAELDREIQEKKPWKSKDKEVIKNIVVRLYKVGHMIKPFMPETSEKIQNAIKENKMPEPLFKRID